MYWTSRAEKLQYVDSFNKNITLIGLVKEVKPYSVYRYLYILARVPK